MSDSPHLLVGAFAVDALDAAERAEFETHLDNCPDCAEEVRGLVATAARLGSAQALHPPAELRRSVLAEIARTPQERGLSAAPAIPATRAQFGPAAARGPGRPWMGRGAQRLLTVAAALLAVIAVGLGALVLQVRSDRDSLASAQRQLTAVLTAPDSRTIGASMPGGGRAVVVVSDSRHSAALVGNGMPALTGGRVYQLWYMGSDNSAVSAGVFTPGSNGAAAIVLQGDPTKAAKVGLTVEPAGGSVRPTTTPILAVPIAT